MKTINILVPDLPESVSDATVVTWHKKIGDIVNCDDNIVDIETDKVMLEVSSPCDGILELILEKEGKIVKSQQILGNITELDIFKKNSSKNILSEEKSLLDLKTSSKIHQDKIIDCPQKNIKYFTPSIRRLIKINKNNLPLVAQEINVKANFKKDIHEDKKSLNIHMNFDSEKKDNQNINSRVKMTRLRQKISERLLASQRNTAMLTTFNEVNMQPIIILRKKYSEIFKEKYGVRIGFMSFYVKAVIEALKKFPVINAYIDDDDIVYYKNFDISIAISTPRGLITPVLRNADNMTMAEIEKNIKIFSEKGLNNTISIKELTGGNFTITNGGVFGSLMSTPIINPPQTAILGMHLIQDRPMAVKGKIKILPMMYLALSYDHRLVDGKESVNFLVSIKNILEDFTRILIDV